MPATSPISGPFAALALALIIFACPGRGQELSPGELEAARVTRPIARLKTTKAVCDFRVGGATGEAQAFFNQGIAQLHALEATAADHSFFRATELAPDCAMAWWGLAVANVEKRVLARYYLERAVKLRPSTTLRERSWIAAWEAYLDDGTADAERRQQLVKTLDRLASEAPDDAEAVAFLARQLLDNRAIAMPVPFMTAVDALMERVLRSQPAHPMALYRLLLWEGNRTQVVEDCVAVVRRTLADSPRALTAAGRALLRLGCQSEAMECFGAAQTLFRDRSGESGANLLDLPGYVENTGHVLTCLRAQGRLAEAITLSRHLIELPAVFQADESSSIVADTHAKKAVVLTPFGSDNAGAALTGQRHWVEILLGEERWEDLKVALRSPYFAVTGPEAAGLRAHALGRAFLALGEKEKVSALRAELEQLAAQMPAGGWHLADEAFRARQRRFEDMAEELKVGIERPKSAETPPLAVASPGRHAADALPVDWVPAPAPAFSLPDAQNKQVTLRSHAGKPLLLVFYRGAGCPHCIEQLRALAPLHAEFAQDGIAVLAVSTDNVAGLKETLNAVGAETAVPFPLVSDQPLKAFQAYGAMDPRTGEAWHGAFLIDASGRILWRHVGAEPFMAVGSLLAEAQRTLRLQAVRPPAGRGETTSIR
jgi:peroxiredoxin/tetratricopeptide (TPR) repeat protein